MRRYPPCRLLRVLFVVSLGLLCVCLVCLPAVSQESEVALICVALPTGTGGAVTDIEVRDRLVKGLGQHQGDKKLAMVLKVVVLDAPPGGRVIAESKGKGCAFVLYSHVRAIETSEQYMPSYSDQTIGTRPVARATVEYLIRRVTDGATYAEGVAKSDESVSDKDAILQAVERAGSEVFADMGKGGIIARGEAATLEKMVPVPSRQVPEGGSFCGWLPSDIPHGEAVRGVCEWAIALPQQLPNFICQMSTSRYQGRNKVPVDLITATVRYEDGDESYSDLKVNGKSAQESAARAAGLWSSGQFEGSLRAIFHAKNQAVFTYSGEKTLDGRAVWVFTFRIARQNEPLWQLRGTDEVIAPPYTGELWVDQSTGTVLRFRSSAKDLPPKFPMQSAEVETDYGNVEFGDGTSFVLPVASSVATQYQGMEPTRNVMQFRGCHKFRAKARILVAEDAGAGGDAAVANPEESLSAELEQNRTIYDILREQAIREDDARMEEERRVELGAARDVAEKKLEELEYERRALEARRSAVHPVTSAPAETASGQSTSGEPLATIKVSVNLVPVSVVTRDAKGHAVGDLNKENFHLFDERKPQVITKFTVEKNDTSAAPRGQTNVAADQPPAEIHKTVPSENDIAYVFDDVGLSREDLSATAAAAGKHLSQMRPEDRAALFTTSGEVGVIFTADKNRLLAALKAMKPHPVPGWNCPPMSYYEADLIVNHADVEASNLAVGEAMGCSQAYTAGQARRLAESRALEVVNTGRANSEQTLGILGEVIARTSSMTGRRMIVLVSPGFVTVAPDSQDKAMALIDRALQAGIVVNALDGTGVGDTPESNAQGDLSRSQFDRQEALARSEVMADLAYGTGGTFFHRNNNMNEGFRQTAEMPEFIYVLGFSPQKLDGKFHKLKVTLNSPEKLSVQARPGYYAVKPVANP